MLPGFQLEDEHLVSRSY